MKPDDIYTMIEGCNTPYLRIFDFNRQKLWVCEDERTAPAAVAKLKNVLPMYAAYKKVIVEGATDKQKLLNYKDCFRWQCEFETTTVGAVPTPGNPWEWRMPPGFMPESTMSAQLALIAANNEHAIKMMRLELQLKEKDTKDPIAQAEKLAPYIMYMMGKPIDEIKTLAMASAAWNASLANPGAGAIAGPPTNTLKMMSVDELGKLTEDERAKKCQAALDALAQHISKEHMIILCERLEAKLNKTKGGNPEFINTVLMYI